jgi:isopenicillin N synthase-like dioxygenase
MPAPTLSNCNAAASDEVIDLPLFDISRETPELGKAVVQAAAKWGFLWVAGSPGPDGPGDETGYDLDEEVVDNVFSISESFFKETPASEKQRCSIKYNRGFIGMHVENLDPSKHKRGDFKQAFNLAEADLTTGQWQQPMPSVFSRNDAALRDFQARCRRMAFRILRLIALGLGIEDVNWLVRCHENAMHSARFLYYPTLSPDTDYKPEADIRAGAHSDYGSITLLFTRPDQPGLEILTPDGRSWASVPVFPVNYHSTTFPPIVVNIGDLLDYWTSGLLKSTVHRVILTKPPITSDRTVDESEADRFSIAIFVQPADDTALTPIPSAAVQARASSFKDKFAGHHNGVSNAQAEMTAGEHLKSRLRATYGDVFTEEPKKTSAVAA